MARHTPADADELAALLAGRADDAPPLLATGRPADSGDGGAAADVSAETSPVDVLSTARMAGLVEVRPRDLTVTVEAGTRVADLLHALADRSLWCALAGTALERSVGGLVAAAPWGPLDASHGDLRRQLLACELVTHDGERVRWGRAVLKDVAGYGMTRAVAGAWGTVGVVHRATLRLWPAPEEDRVVPLVAGEGDAVALAARVAGSDLDARVRPDAATWSAGGAGATTLELRLLGTSGSVEEREERLRAWAPEVGAEAGAARASEPTESRASAPAEPRAGGADGGPAAGAHDRDRSVGRVALATGRRDLGAVLRRLRREMGDDLLRTEADLLGGRLRCAYRRTDDGGTVTGEASPPAAFRRLLDAAGDVPVRVERGSAAEISAAAERRSAGARRLEERVREALGGRPRHWLADYV